jgi:hypothetical protein
MKAKNTFCIMIIALLIISCKKEPVATPAAKDSTAVDTTTAVKHTVTDSLTVLVTDFTARKKEVQQKLQAANPEQADRLYDAYFTQNSARVARINGQEEQILENYWGVFYEGDGKEKKLPDSIQYKVNLLKSTGLEFWNVGEGFGEIRTVPDFYADIFKNYVSKDYRQYILMLAEDDKELFAADAGIIIPWNAVGKRMFGWETFLKTYPNSALAPKAKEWYKYYQESYLLGMENTRTIEYTDGSIYPETKQEFENFIAKHPDSPTAKLVKIVLNHSGTFDELTAIIQKEQKALGL